MKRKPRDYTFRVRLNADERKLLAVLVRHHGVTSSEAVRMLIAQAVRMLIAQEARAIRTSL